MQTFLSIFMSLLTNSFPPSLVLPYFLDARNHHWTFSNSSSIINQQPTLDTTSVNHFLSVTRQQALLIECLFWPRPNQFWQLSHLHCPIQWGLRNQKSRVSKLMAVTQHRLSSHIHVENVFAHPDSSEPDCWNMLGRTVETQRALVRSISILTRLRLINSPSVS